MNKLVQIVIKYDALLRFPKKWDPEKPRDLASLSRVFGVKISGSYPSYPAPAK